MKLRNLLLLLLILAVLFGAVLYAGIASGIQAAKER